MKIERGTKCPPARLFAEVDVTYGLERFDRPVFLALGRCDFIVAPPSSLPTRWRLLGQVAADIASFHSAAQDRFLRCGGVV
jgi:hypothetical protein